MSQRLPVPGGDNGDWGNILNSFLEVSLNSDGSLANNTVGTNQLQNNAVTNAQLDSPTQSAISLANSSLQTSQLGADSGVAQLTSGGYLVGSELPLSVVTANSTPAETTGVPWVYNVKDGAYGATGNGTTDDTTAITACFNAAITAGSGIIYFPPGTYKVSSTLPTINAIGLSIIGAGSGAVTIVPTSGLSGAVMRIQMNPFTVSQAGKFAGFTLEGEHTGNNVYGIHYGDTIQGAFDDVVIQDFTGTGSVGIWMDNATDWTERTEFNRVRLLNNTTSMKFSAESPGTDSFGYTGLDVEINCNASQTGILVESGTVIYGCSKFFVRGNLGGNSAVGIDVYGQLVGNLYSIHLENDTSGGGTGVLGLKIESGGFVSGFGVFDLASSGLLTNSNLAGNTGIVVGGFIQMPGILDGATGNTSVGGWEIIQGENYPAYAGGWTDNTNLYLNPNPSGGLIVLRPNGPGSGTGQWYLDQNGLMHSTGTTTTSASTGSASALPTAPAGYKEEVINGTTYKIPYYNV